MVKHDQADTFDSSSDVSLTDTSATQDELGGVIDGIDSSTDASSSDLAVGGGSVAAGFDDVDFGGGVTDKYSNINIVAVVAPINGLVGRNS